jgi:flagellar basal-body rod modification protein FlgD
MAGLSPIAGALQQQQPPGAPGSGLNSTLNSSDFLSLLTTEMKNQDPMNPVDDTQSMAQLAQFSSLSAMEEMNQSFQTFQSNFGVMQSAGLLGKTVTVSTPNASGNSSSVTGTVASIAVQNGQPYFTMNGPNGKPLTDNSGQPLLFSTTEIVGIGG